MADDAALSTATVVTIRVTPSGALPQERLQQSSGGTASVPLLDRALAQH